MNAMFYENIIGMLSELSTVYDAVPGQAFEPGHDVIARMSDMEYRSEESDFKQAVSDYNQMFVKNSNISIEDICLGYTAYIRLKVLSENRSDTFTPVVRRELIKEYKNAFVKVDNTIRVNSVMKMNVDTYKKVEIEKKEVVIGKLKEILQAEITKLEEMISSEPESVKAEGNEVKNVVPGVIQKEADAGSAAPEPIAPPAVPKPPKAEKKSNESSAKSLFSGLAGKMSGVFEKKKNVKETENRLRKEEADHAKTVCAEIPFYDSVLTFDNSEVCKDIPYYSLLRRKNTIYFGITDHIKGSKYDNSDGSLIELTKATDEFWQYMTVDLVNGDYVLRPFSDSEKVSLTMYFLFVCYIFEREIGKALNMHEYISFKNYYNTLVQAMFDAEKKGKEDYYKALQMSDSYMQYMDCYGLKYAETKETIVEKILHHDVSGYLQDLNSILECHIANETAKKSLADLIEYFHSFEEKEEIPEETVQEENLSSEDGSEGYPSFSGEPGMVNAQYITSEDLKKLSIVVSFTGKEQFEYSPDNLKSAVSQFLALVPGVRKIGVKADTKTIFLYMSKNGRNAGLILNDAQKAVLCLDNQEALRTLKFYELQMKTLFEAFLQ